MKSRERELRVVQSWIAYYEGESVKGMLMIVIAAVIMLFLSAYLVVFGYATFSYPGNPVTATFFGVSLTLEIVGGVVVGKGIVKVRDSKRSLIGERQRLRELVQELSAISRF